MIPTADIAPACKTAIRNQRGASEKKKQPAAVYVSLRNSITCLHLFSSSRRLTADSYSLLHSNRRIFFTNKNHLVKENPYRQNSRLRLISLNPTPHNTAAEPDLPQTFLHL
jgi:hypothetical protein